MDCNKANKIMMSFMDNSILEEEYILLEAHLEKCQECKKDFSLYTEMLNGFFEDIGEIEPPIDFEENVMAMIQDIEPKYIEIKNRTNKFYYLVAGFIALLFTITTIFKFNKEFIFTNFDENSIIYQLLEFDKYISLSSKSIFEFFCNIFYIIENNLSYFIDYLRVSSLIATLILIFAQFVVYRRNKVKA